jgi:outer membrane protein TolC
MISLLKQMSIRHFLKFKLMKAYFKRSGKENVLSIVVAAMVMLSIGAKAQNTITLSQAINKGLESKKDILAGNLDVSISILQTQNLYHKYWPQASVDYNYYYNPILQTSILPIGLFNPAYPEDALINLQFGTNWTQTAGLNLSQPLLDLSINRNISEAKLQERIAAFSQEKSANELAYTIAQTYIDIYLEEAKIKSLIADTNRTYISYSLLKDKFDEQSLLKSDLNKSKVNHNNTVQLLYDGISQLIEDKVYLLYLMGENEVDKWDFEVENAFFTENTIEKTLLTTNLDQLPELQELTLQSQLAALKSKSENAKHIPTISFQGYLGANQFTNSFNPIEANTWYGLSYLGLDIKIPILFGESTSNKIEQLKIQSEQYSLQKEDKTLQYTKDVYTAKRRMENIQMQLKTQEENISLSAESINIIQDRVLEGQEAALNLNLEEASLQALEANYESNKKQLWLYWLDYLKATGQLSILWE